MNLVAIVTGAASPQGAAIARALHRQRRSVALLDGDLEAIKRLSAELVAAGGKSVAIGSDLSRSDSVRPAIIEAQACLGPIAILAHCGGLRGERQRLDEIPEGIWDDITGKSLKSLYLFARDLLPGMKGRGFGRIITVSSTHGLGGVEGHGASSASQHGVLGLTKTIATEWRAHGITANVICASQAPHPTHEQIASLVNYLISEQGAAINGASLVIDGGNAAQLRID